MADPDRIRTKLGRLEEYLEGFREFARETAAFAGIA